MLRHRIQVTAKTADADALAERIEEIEDVDEVHVPSFSIWQKLYMKWRWS